MAELIQQIAERNNATPAQIALAWILAQKAWIEPIPGTTKINRLEENVSSASVQLSLSDLQEIERAVSEITIQGNRYPESSQKMIDNN